MDEFMRMQGAVERRLRRHMPALAFRVGERHGFLAIMLLDAENDTVRSLIRGHVQHVVKGKPFVVGPIASLTD